MDKSKDVKCVLCEGNHPSNYKGCMVYKDLQRNFFPTLRRKAITSEPQLRIEPANIPGMSNQENYMPQSQEPKVNNQIPTKENQETQEKITTPSPEQLVTSIMQELQNMMKEKNI